MAGTGRLSTPQATLPTAGSPTRDTAMSLPAPGPAHSGIPRELLCLTLLLFI